MFHVDDEEKHRDGGNYKNLRGWAIIFDGSGFANILRGQDQGGSVRQAVGEVQSLELHQYKIAMVLSTILIKNKVFLHYKMVFYEILNHNLYLFVLCLI